MSRPALKTYGRTARPVSTHPDLTDPYGSSPPPYTFSFDTPPSTPSPPPVKRSRLYAPSSDTGMVEAELDMECEEHTGMGEKSTMGSGKMGQSTLKGFFTAKPGSRTVSRPLVESKRAVNVDASSGLSSPDPPTMPSSAKSARSGHQANVPSDERPATIRGAPDLRRPSSHTQLRLTHLPLLHSCKECHMSYVRGGEDEAVHTKHHGRVVRGIPWEGLGRGSSRAGATAKGRALSRNGSDGATTAGSGSSGPGWKEVDEFGAGGSRWEGRLGRVRIVECDAGYGGAKLEEILSLVDLSLSSPPLPQSILDRCKVYLAITSSPPPARPRSGSGTAKLAPTASSSSMSGSKGKARAPKERVVGVVVSQGIKWAMRVLGEEGDGGLGTDASVSCRGADAAASHGHADRGGAWRDAKQSRVQRQTLLRMGPLASDVSSGADEAKDVKLEQQRDGELETAREVKPLVKHLPIPASSTTTQESHAGISTRMIDSGDGVMCDPTPLPTQLGIHRLYTIPTYRSIGIAEALLDAACAHTIYACPARPEKGQVAFSQPTQSGARMMRRWGRGGVRVFVDDESQL